MDSPVGTLIGSGRFSTRSSRGGDEWVPALPLAVMRDGFILLLTVFLSSLVAAAQTHTPQTGPAQELVAPIITGFQAVLVPSPARSFVLSDDPGQSAAHCSYLFVRAYERDQGLGNLSPIQRIKTLFLMQSGLPLFQLWDGRLRLEGFTRRLHTQNVPLGSPAVGGLQNLCCPGGSYPGGLRSVRFYGLSLSVHFERHEEIGRPTQTWRSFARFVRAPR